MLDLKMDVRTDAIVRRRAQMQMGTRRHNEWVVRCHHGGKLKWQAYVPHNLVPTEGLNHGITSEFLGSSYTAAWYIGLVDATPTFAAADTMASHGGWSEIAAYTEVNRQTLTLGAVAGGSAHNHANVGTFSINAPATVGGMFLCTDSAIGSANGTIGGEGAFTTGNKAVGSGDSLSVQVAVYAAAG